MAVDLNGSSDKVVVAHHASLSMIDSITIIIRIKQEVGGSFQCIIHKGTGTSSSDIVENYRITVNASDKIQFYYGNVGIINLRIFTLDAFTLSQGVWTFIAVTFDWPTLASIKFNVNGVEYDDSDGTWTDGFGAPTSDLAVNVNSADLKVGTRAFSGFIQYFNGIVDGSLIYKDSVLTNDQLLLHYKPWLMGMGGQILPSNRAIDLHMVDGPIGSSANGVTFDDRSGKGNDGTGTGGVFRGGSLSNPREPIYSAPLIAGNPWYYYAQQ